MVELTDPLLHQLTRRLAPEIANLRPLSGGASGLTYTGDRAGQPVVVKVAPPGVEPTLNRDVLRQSHMLRRLASTPVPVPDVVWEDAGHPPQVPPLFVMSLIEGDSHEPLFDLDVAVEPDEVVAQRLRNAAATLARLHRVDSSDLRLESEPVVGPAAEIDRWCRTLETVDPGLAPEWRYVRDELRSSVPSEVAPSIVHGDFRLGNMLATDDRITAVVDWEIWSIGDPRIDVGWFLINCDPQTYRRATRYAGVTPPPEELAEHYRNELGRDLPELNWFCALACFKSVATWSLIIKHNRRRSSPQPDVEAMARVLPGLLSRTKHLLS